MNTSALTRLAMAVAEVERDWRRGDYASQRSAMATVEDCTIDLGIELAASATVHSNRARETAATIQRALIVACAQTRGADEDPRPCLAEITRRRDSYREVRQFVANPTNTIGAE